MFANNPAFSLSEKQMKNMVTDFLWSNPEILTYCLQLYALRKLTESIEDKLADEFGEAIVNTVLAEIASNINDGGGES